MTSPGFLVRGSLGYAGSWAKNVVKAALGKNIFLVKSYKLN